MYPATELPAPAPGTLELALQNPARSPEAAARRLEPWLRPLLTELAATGSALPVSVSIRFTTDREVRRLNREFRGRDAATDVLSFPGGETPEGLHLGDVVIAVPTARRQAAAAGHGLERELRILVLHGVLHCLGYDHEADDGEMERLETRLRRRWIEPGSDAPRRAAGGVA